MKRNEKARKCERDEMGNEKEERRDDDEEGCEPIGASLERATADEVRVIIRERGSIRGIKL